MKEEKPTIIYFHGGGYFGGDKCMGDPLAVNNDSNYLFDALLEYGYSFVNVNYALVQEHHFPDPIIQINEAKFKLTEEPKLKIEDIRALVIDDISLEVNELDGVATKILIGSYLNQSIFFTNEEMNDQYSALRYIIAEFPRSFMIAGIDDGFPNSMKSLSDKLTELGVKNEYFYTTENKYGLTKHGYLSNLANDTSGASRDCLDSLVKFLSETKKEQVN